MSRWKAKGPKPVTRFCWLRSRQLHGRQFSEVDGGDGHKHAVHKTCAKGPPAGYRDWDQFYTENQTGKL
jgi:hypothetical protein